MGLILPPESTLRALIMWPPEERLGRTLTAVMRVQNHKSQDISSRVVS